MPAYLKPNWRTGLLTILCLGGALAASGQTTLTHRYSFTDPAGSSSFADSVGSATGTLNNATAVNPNSASLDGSQLQLDGTGGYALLPAGMISGYSQVTIETWVSVGINNAAWTRIFSFGDQNGTVENTGVDFCPFAPGNYQNLNIQSATGGGYANNSTSLLGTTNVHVTVVIDPVNNSKYYYNGTVIVSTDNGTTPALNTINDAYGLIGRSLADVDPALIGAVNEFRIYSGVLSPAAVALNDAVGPDNYITSLGTIVALHFSSSVATLAINQSVPQTLLGDFSNVSNLDLITYGGATFSSLNTNVATISTGGVVKAISTGTASVVATYGSISATNSITVNSPPIALVHRYSFASDASDSIGGANGTLMGSATVSGGQLVLDGTTGCYLSLPGNQIDLATNAAVTIDAWVTFGNDTTWAELYAFGNTNAGNGVNNIACVPCANPGGFQHWGITENFPSNGHTPGLAHGWNNITAHVTAVIDPPNSTISLYRDGVLEVAEYADSGALNNIATNYAFIGRSPFDADPYLPASVDEFRIYNGALTPAQVAVENAGGTSSTNMNPGALSSILVVATNYPAHSILVAPVVLANYANLAGFNLLPTVTAGGNVAYSGPNGLVITSSDPTVASVNSQNILTTFRPGTITLTAHFGGKTSSAVVNIVNQSKLTHRYSFTSDASDSIGTANGALQGAATVSGGQLQLTGNNADYLALPNNMLTNYTSVTVDTWVTFAAMQNWARLWEFADNGNGGTVNEFYYAPGWNPNPPNAQLYSAGFPYGNSTQVAGALLTQTYHITCEYGNGELLVYTNGVLESEVTNMIAPASSAGLNYATLGHSPYSDPGIDGTIDEFRIYNGLLTTDEVQASDLLGPNQTLSTSAHLSTVTGPGQITLSWPLANAGFVVQATPTLSPSSWTTLTNIPALIGNTNWQVSLPVGSSGQYFRLAR